MKRFSLAVLLIAALAVPSVALASPGDANGFAGSYTAIDCATWWEERPDGLHDVDCSIWGDGSTMTLTIGRGAKPRIVFADDFATVCANAGLPTSFTGVGYGLFDDPNNLAVTLTATRCGTVPRGPAEGIGLYGPEPTLWDDPDGDGWGTVWYPTD